MLILSDTARRIAAGCCNYIHTRFPAGHDVPVCGIDQEWFADLAQKEIHAATGMTWTTGVPSEGGWYWLRSPGESSVRVVEVATWDVPPLLKECSGWHPLTDYTTAGYQFAGPIPKPTEASK